MGKGRRNVSTDVHWRHMHMILFNLMLITFNLLNTKVRIGEFERDSATPPFFPLANTSRGKTNGKIFIHSCFLFAICFQITASNSKICATITTTNGITFICRIYSILGQLSSIVVMWCNELITDTLDRCTQNASFDFHMAECMRNNVTRYRWQWYISHALQAFRSCSRSEYSCCLVHENDNMICVSRMSCFE